MQIRYLDRETFGRLGRTAIFLIAALVVAAPADAWWSQGHRHITQAAVAYLPQPLRGFFTTNLTTLRNRSGQEPQGKHYIDIDLYDEFHAGEFPRDLDELVAIHGWETVDARGRGPWTYADYVETLTTQMQNARTNADWLALITVAAEQAHYIEDLHNPLHLTDNHDGQHTGNNGIHGRYEGDMIAFNIGALTFTPASATYLPSVIDNVFDGIDIHWQFVDDIIAADTAAKTVQVLPYDQFYFASLWNQTGAFTQALFQDASEAVADGWYTAWVNAGSPTPNFGLKGDYNGDNVIDAADFTVWRNAMSSPGANLMNDATPASVNFADYSYWKLHYGESIALGAGGFVALPVPEPMAAVYIAIALVMASAARVGRR